MRFVPINCIKADTYLAKTIYDHNGTVLLAKGVKLTDLILDRVKFYGMLSLYIQDEYSDHEIKDVIKPELRQKAIHTVKKFFHFFDTDQERLDTTKDRNRYLKMKSEYIQSLYNIAENIIEEILEQKNVLINLVDIKIMDDYTYAHCVNVAILSLVLGIELGFNKKQLLDLAIGAMLHDLGKIFVPQEVLNKKGKLDDKEYKIIKEHPEKGYEYLKDIYDISSVSRVVALQHHEKIDGTGYPEKLKGEKIHLFSKIVSIADVYDALTSDRPYRRGLSPNEAIEYIMGSVDQYFDYDMVKAFIGKIVPYPIGTLVRLSNQCIGVIEEINPSLPLRPIVKIIVGNHNYSEDDIIDLYYEYDIVIEGVQHEEPERGNQEQASGC